MSMTAPLDIQSIGRTAAELQIPLHRIRQAAEDLGIVAHRINGITHYTADDIRIIDEHLRGEQEDRAERRGRG